MKAEDIQQGKKYKDKLGYVVEVQQIFSYGGNTVVNYKYIKKPLWIMDDNTYGVPVKYFFEDYMEIL